jgi:hypothetical protein
MPSISENVTWTVEFSRQDILVVIAALRSCVGYSWYSPRLPDIIKDISHPDLMRWFVDYVPEADFKDDIKNITSEDLADFWADKPVTDPIDDIPETTPAPFSAGDWVVYKDVISLAEVEHYGLSDVISGNSREVFCVQAIDYVDDLSINYIKVKGKWCPDDLFVRVHCSQDDSAVLDDKADILERLNADLDKHFGVSKSFPRRR